MFNSKEYYIKNREKVLKYSNQWKENNPEKVEKYNRQYYKEHLMEKKRYRKRKNELTRLRHKKLKEWFSNYKLSKGCSVCSYNKCAAALDFHHTSNKNFGISRLICQSRSPKYIKKEIDKCIILCANCHRELHAREKSEIILS